MSDREQAAIQRNLDFEKLPERFRGGMERYLEHGIMPGHFMTAVLENNLSESFARADDEARQLLFAIVSFCYNELPLTAWGSAEKVRGWVARIQEAAHAEG